MFSGALETLSRDAHTSPCWQNAVGALVRGCRDIEADDIERSRFAVQLANCHLAKSGFDTYPCTSSMTIAQCTSGMDTIAFNSYTNFYVSSGKHIPPPLLFFPATVMLI